MTGVRRRIGEAKGQSEIAQQWISYSRSMVESPALRVLSRAAHLVMRRVEAEHMAHGGAENGKLIVTYRQFEEWGVHTASIAPAIREIAALGFAQVTEHGHAGVGGYGKANRFRLTYVNSKQRIEPSNEWQRIETLEEAERVAAEARAEKNQRARELGARGGKATQKKHFTATKTVAELSYGNRNRKSNHEPTETVGTIARLRKP